MNKKAKNMYTYIIIKPHTANRSFYRVRMHMTYWSLTVMWL